MSNIRFAHIRPDNSTRSGALTIAFRDGPVPNTVEFAVSRCSTKDAFCKATGRAYAEGRLRQRLGHTMAISRDASYSSVVEAIKQSDPVRLITRSRSARKLVGHAA